jgi:[ribosomal protein S18]-alanine N-acetyltransferase
LTDPEPLLRPMRVSDLLAVMEIDRQSLPKPWSEFVWREELSSPFGLYLVLEEDGSVSGHIGLKLIFGEAHIMTLAVHPERRRRGFARTLIEAALAAPVSAGMRRVYLEVRPSNLAARALYRSLGFVETGVRTGYYGDEDALLMTLDLRKGLRR